MQDTANIRLINQNYDCPIIVGSEGELGIDIRSLRNETGYITFDDGYANTGSCASKITFVDGERGILRYRGYPVEQLAEQSSFIETSYLIIYGELPTQQQLAAYREKIIEHARLHISMRHFFEGFPESSHPMAILSAQLNSLGCYHPKLASNDRSEAIQHFDEAAALIISKTRTIAAMAYRMKEGLPFAYPKPKLQYSQNFLHMMFSEPYDDYIPSDEISAALDLIFLLHADHEQNCSTSTVRMVGSGGANLFASVAAGVCALWGNFHGGANMAVVQMLEAIHRDNDNGSRFIEAAKQGQARLMGFGHRVYKNYDPRAKILRNHCERVLRAVGSKHDPLLSIARRLEEQALKDDYFIQRKLYPNVDFYSGIILQAIGLPLNLFTVIFAIGRMPGWIAHWREVAMNPKSRIYRPRQIYTGATQRNYVPVAQR